MLLLTLVTAPVATKEASDMPNTKEFALGYEAALSEWKREMSSDIDASELSIGEGIAFRAGFLAGWVKAKEMVLGKMDPNNEEIIDACCPVSVGIVKDLVEDMGAPKE